MTHVLLPAAVALFGLSTAFYLAALWSSRPALRRIGHTALGLTLLVAAGAVFALVGDPLEGTYTQVGLVVSALVLGAVYLVLTRRYPIAGLGSFVSALATLLVIFAFLGGQAAPSPTPTVLDGLLRVHIVLAFVGVTAFAFSTSVSVVYLMQARLLKQKSNVELRRRLPPLDVLDRLALKGIVLGFPFYTVSILLGSAYAIRTDHLRASYVLAIVSWAIYGVVLQARLTAGWRGQRAAVLTTAGLLVVLGAVAQYSFGVG